jgi:RNA polymerase sigma-70 factor (ECF subfamily)
MTMQARQSTVSERGRGQGEDERRLVHRAALEGDHGAYAQLVSKYADPIFRIAARFAGKPEAVNDLAELVFVRAWERFDQWDELADFRTWLYQVAIETCLEHANGPGKHLSASDYTIDDLVKTPRDRSQAEIVMTRDDLIAVYKELEKLPPSMRAVVILRALEGASYRDLSSILRQPVSTIDTWMRHGLATLKGALSRY